MRLNRQWAARKRIEDFQTIVVYRTVIDKFLPRDGAETPGRSRDPRTEQTPRDGAETPGRSRDPRIEAPGQSRDPRTEQRPKDGIETPG